MIAAVKAVHSGAQQAERAVGAEYYRAEVDGLRGIAILAVLGFHAFPEYFPGGFVGVDVFFVVSGFLISSIVLRQLRRSTFTFSNFYARRIRRIFPALVLVLAACLTFGSVALLPDEFSELGKHVASAAGFVSNFTLWQESGYFDRAAELKPLLHLWSLGVEEQFYLLWPLLLLLLWKHQQRNLAANVLLLTLGSFALSVGIAQKDPLANFYFPFSRFWELGLGCLLAVIKDSPEAANRWFRESGAGAVLRSPRVHSMLAVSGSALIAAAVFLFDRRTTFPGWAALAPTIGAMCVIGARSDAWFQKRVMASSGLVFVGLISYPLYLWHWPLLSFATILESGAPDVSTRATAALLSVVLALLTYGYVEQPIRARRSGRAAVNLAVALLILGVAGAATYSAKGFPDRFKADLGALRAGPRTDAACTRNFPANAGFNYCKSTSSGPPTAVVLGDSRAQVVYDAIVELTRAREPMTLLARGGCPALLNVDLHYLDQERCADAWDRFVEYVEDVRPDTVVIIGGGSGLMDPAIETLTTYGGDFDSREAAFRHGLRELVIALQRHSRVVYVTAFPHFQSGPDCFLRPISLPRTKCSPIVPRSTVEANMARYHAVVRDIQKELPELQLVESIEILCDSSVCSQKLASGEILYSDNLHLSPAGARYFAQKARLLDMMFDDVMDSEFQTDQQTPTHRAMN